jgi:hypothetical protein
MTPTFSTGWSPSLIMEPFPKSFYILAIAVCKAFSVSSPTAGPVAVDYAIVF